MNDFHRRSPSRHFACGRLAWAALAIGMIAAGMPLALRAAEFHVHAEFRTAGGLVLVKDVADVYATDPDEAKALGEIDLIAAPADGQKRFLPLREIQDLLVLRGLNLREHRFTGASQVKIIGVIEARPSMPRSAPPPSPVKQATETVRAAIGRYLGRKSEDADSWTVKVTLSEEQAAQVASAMQAISVEGVWPPGPAGSRSW